MNEDTDISIYVACLASYNAGKLYGAWIELDYIDDLDQLQEEVQEMLAESPIPNAEEWAIHDTENLPGDTIGLEIAWNTHEIIKEHGDIARAAIQYSGMEYAAELCEHFSGSFKSYEEYGDECLENEDVPEHLLTYIDSESYGKDSAQDYTSVEYADYIYLFNC